MTAYVYRGTNRDAPVDLVAANAAILADRDASDSRSVEGNPGWEWPSQRATRLKEIGCGSEEGYRRHLRWHEPTCDECKAAHRNRKQARP